MNKQRKQLLGAVVGAMVEQDTAAAKAAFHDYLRLKSQAVLLGESDDKDDEDADKDEDDKDDEDADKDDADKDESKDAKKSKKAKKSDDCDM